jgi:hypothetical protein
MSDENALNQLEIGGDVTPEKQPTPEPETPPESGTVDEAPKIPPDIQAEIEKLEAQRKKAEEDAKYWRRQKAEARAEYFRDRNKPPEPPETPAAPTAEIEKPDPDKYDDYNDYVDALTEYKVETKRREWERDEQIKAEHRNTEARMARLQEKINLGYSKYEDFEQVALDETVPITPVIADILAESDMPAEVAYYLGKNRTEAIAISRMTPVAAARAIGRIESQIESPQPRTQTNAPPPIKPVGGGPSVAKDPEKMSQKEYEAWRREQGARRY